MAEAKTRKFIMIEAFQEKLKSTGTSVIEDLLITSTCEIKPGDIEWDGVEFINCEFQSNLAFSGIKIKHGIKLTECIINGSVFFAKCTVTDYDPHFNIEPYSIIIKDCEIGESLHFSDCPNIDRGIKISGKKNCKNLYINNVKAENGGIYLSKFKVESHCDIENNVVSSDIRFHKCEIEPKTRIMNNSCAYLSFTHSEFKSDVHVGSGKIRDLVFNGGVFHDDFSVYPFTSQGQLTLIGSEFKSKFSLSYSDPNIDFYGGCKKIYLSACSFGLGMSIVGSHNLLKMPLLEKVSVVANEKLSGDITFRCFDVKEFEFFQNNANSKIKLHTVQPLKLSFFEFSNSGKIQFFDVKAYHEGDSELEIFNSNLGITEFYNTFLDSFKNVSITNSVLSDIITSNIRWFRKELLEPESHVQELVKHSDYRNNREVFRQLKYAMEKQGNKIYALEFKSYEMESYKKELKFKPQKKFVDRISRLILRLNWLSNNHGIDPVRPIGWIIILTLLFYWLIVISITPTLTFVPSIWLVDWQNSWHEFTKYWSAIPKMVNPIFSFDKTFKGMESLRLTTSALEFLHRIIVSYLLFQFVAAFRKFVK